MHPNTKLLEDFYSSFAQRNHAAMIACYAPDIAFSDAIFRLTGKQAGAMWHMLCESGKDLKLNFSDIYADDEIGRAHWEAHYTFSGTGRVVRNVVDAEFQFQDGLIVAHQDQFHFWRWSRMALGPMGWLLGWTRTLQRGVQGSAQKSLERFIEKNPQYQA